jgi:nucleotide-binding universal stress UspA family protein
MQAFRHGTGLAINPERKEDTVNSIQRILWPTDFSDEARRALPLVNGFARHFSAHVEIVHVLSPTPAMAAMAGSAALAMNEYITSMDEHARETLGGIAENDIETGIPAIWNILAGSPAHEISEYAKDHEIDLIILATNGETGLSRLITGSVAEKVVRFAPCPVLSVPPRPE